MIYSTLGDIEIEVITGPSRFEAKHIASYGEHTLINRKSSLQFTGFSPDDINLTIRLHASYCNPGEILKRFKDHLDKRSTLSYVQANGEYKGVFVIAEMGLALEHTDTSGNVIALEFTVALKEYTGDPAKPNPPGVISTRSPQLVSSQNLTIPNLVSPDNFMANIQKAMEVANKVTKAADRVNSIVQAAQSGDILGAVSAAGTYAPELAQMAAMLPVEEFQDLSQVVTIANDAGAAAKQLNVVRSHLNQAGNLLSNPNGLSGLSSASNSIQSALSATQSAAPALNRLEASAQVGSRLMGLLP